MTRILNIIDNLTDQAKLALLAGVLTLIAAFMKSKRMNADAAIAMVLIITTSILSTYAVDCYSKGQCELWAWITAGFMFGTAVVTLSSSLS